MRFWELWGAGKAVDAVQPGGGGGCAEQGCTWLILLCAFLGACWLVTIFL
jgi:hypothetical protein